MGHRNSLSVQKKPEKLQKKQPQTRGQKIIKNLTEDKVDKKFKIMSAQKNNWFKSMLSSEGNVSSKRVVSMFTMLNLIAFCYIAAFTEHELPEYMFDALSLISGGGLGLTVIEAIFKKPGKGEIKTDTPPNEQILQ